MVNLSVLLRACPQSSGGDVPTSDTCQVAGDLRNRATHRVRTWFLRSLAVALTAAAVAKALFPVVPSLGETSLLASPAVHSAIVMLELLAAAWFWLAADRFPRLTRWGGTALFGGFAFVSLRSLLNATSCNCFGSLAIPPGATLTFDLFAVLGLNCLFSSSPLATRSNFGLRVGRWARGFVHQGDCTLSHLPNSTFSR
jgi:hypothetical protein